MRKNQQACSTSILFLDDDEQVLSSVRKLFRKEPYRLSYFSSPHKALEYLEANRVNLIISDMNMPGMSGEEFLRKANGKGFNSIKLILSGYQEKSIVLDMLAKGNAHYYLMKPWDDAELKNTIKKFCRINEDLESKELQKYLGSFSKLPPPTQITWKLNSLLSGENININNIIDEVKLHPFLTAKILQIANSVSYGVRKEIISLRSAVVLIGLKQLKTLIVSFELLRIFSNLIDKSFVQTINNFWNESLKKALVAKRISEAWDRKIDEDLVFISALFSNIGYIVWLYTEPENFNAFIRLQKEKQISVSEAEQDLFLFEHTKLGAVLLNLWNIPSRIIEITENHHCTEAKDDVLKIVQIADYLTCTDSEFPHDKSIDELAVQFKEKLKI
ncbi:MAG TPA: HDOD domain-containing protein [Ignavibacteriaceae bacterium]|nr:HDOD domain-containing protein [Ignavibacteriaceae bacterium]